MRIRGERPAEAFVLTFWTDDPVLARYADRAGVDRVGPDLEVIGKADRQGRAGTWISPHRQEQIPSVRKSLIQARLFARVNPMHERTAEEVERLLGLGVEVFMLPMFTRAKEVDEFAGMVKARAQIIPLLETAHAAAEVDRLTVREDIDEIHIGLNDLSLSLGLPNRFAALNTSLISEVAAGVRDAGKRLGLGSIARACDASLPVRSDLMYAEYARLGATAALIGKNFLYDGMTETGFALEIERMRQRLCYWFDQDRLEIEHAHAELCSIYPRLVRV
jgi:2-keto-3-deoxy-L-rhamnonate aldolase RhmA